MSHSSGKLYLEYYAKELLEHLFPDQYKNIHKDESPDLRMNDDYGIEVTWAMFENQGQTNGVLNHIKGKENLLSYMKKYERFRKTNHAE